MIYKVLMNIAWFTETKKYYMFTYECKAKKKKIFVFTIRRPTLNFFMALLVEIYLK